MRCTHIKSDCCWSEKWNCCAPSRPTSLCSSISWNSIIEPVHNCECTYIYFFVYITLKIEKNIEGESVQPAIVTKLCRLGCRWITLVLLKTYTLDESQWAAWFAPDYKILEGIIYVAPMHVHECISIENLLARNLQLRHLWLEAKLVGTFDEFVTVFQFTVAD